MNGFPSDKVVGGGITEGGLISYMHCFVKQCSSEMEQRNRKPEAQGNGIQIRRRSGRERELHAGRVSFSPAFKNLQNQYHQKG